MHWKSMKENQFYIDLRKPKNFLVASTKFLRIETLFMCNPSLRKL